MDTGWKIYKEAIDKLEDALSVLENIHPKELSIAQTHNILMYVRKIRDKAEDIRAHKLYSEGK